MAVIKQDNKVQIEHKNVWYRNISSETILLSIFLLLLILLKLPNFFEPYWYSDEGFFATVAQALQNGSKLYKDIWITHQPGIVFVYWIAQFFGKYNLLVVKIINAMFSIGTVYTVYKLARKMFSQQIASIAALTSTLLLGLPIIDGNVAHPEIYAVFFILTGIHFILKNKPVKNLYSGFFFSIALLFSLKTLFIIFPFLLFILFTGIVERKENKSQLFLYYTLGIWIPFGIVLLILGLRGILPEYFYATLIYPLENIISIPSLGFVIFENTLFTRIIVTAFLYFIMVRYYIKGTFTTENYLLALWLVGDIFSILYSHESYSHLLIHMIPCFSIITGLFFIYIYTKKDSLMKLYIVCTYFLGILGILNLFTFGKQLKSNTPITNYYIQFYNYLSKKSDTTTYIQQYSNEAYRQYRLASYIHQNFTDKKDMYIVTNNPWIYNIAEVPPKVKYIRYHEAIKNWEDMKVGLYVHVPEIIIIDETLPQSDEILNYLDLKEFEDIAVFESYKIYKKGFIETE